MTDSFMPAPDPPTELGRYQVLSPTAGVRVSPLCLGAMSIGESWSNFMGSMNKEDSFKLMDAFYEAGGNFIDTANNYQDEQSEQWIGEWMQQKKNRDLMVIATKFTAPYRSHAEGKGKIINYTGNHKRALHVSVRDSLRKLQTDYIDLLYLHWWDYTTSVEEVMDSLHALVQQGKVLYLGVSDTPAWIVAKANTYARAHGKTPFSVYQGRWNVILRDLEREIVPMARDFGMAICPWDVLGGGKFQTAAQLEARKKSGDGLRSFGDRTATAQTQSEEKISQALEKVAGELGIKSITAVALAWAMQKTPYVFPIIGGRKIEHLKDNIGALSLRLSDEQIKYLEDATPFELGFPHNMIGQDPMYTGKTGPMLDMNAKMGFPTPSWSYFKKSAL